MLYVYKDRQIFNGLNVPILLKSSAVNITVNVLNKAKLIFTLFSTVRRLEMKKENRVHEGKFNRYLSMPSRLRLFKSHLIRRYIWV